MWMRVIVRSFACSVVLAARIHILLEWEPAAIERPGDFPGAINAKTWG